MSRNVFNSVQVKAPNQNTFDLSHDFKLSVRFGDLVPVSVVECLPGDVHKFRHESLARFAPLVSPVMHNVNVFMHSFFVPNRILWNNWDDFISPDLSKNTPPAWPHIAFGNTVNFATGSLGDYLGLPTNKAKLPSVSALPFAAYQAVYHEFFRDQNLQPEFDYSLNNGNQSPGTKVSDLFKLRQRAFEHDYFTASLPFAQKGPSVQMPFSATGTGAPVLRNSDQGNSPLPNWEAAGVGSGGLVNVTNRKKPVGGIPVADFGLYVDPADLSIGGTINDLRVALRLQEFFEKSARGGTRYIEQIRMHYGTIVPDYRLNRPEFIGGTKNPVVISEVLQTSESSTSPQGNMAGHAISANRGKSFRYRCLEHGYIITLMSFLPRTAYQQGIPRHFSRITWQDYAWPTFAHLGEQAVLNKELYHDGDDGKNDETFGYVPRYSEYRYIPSRVAGEFKTTLAHWHMGRIFANRPALNEQFIVANAGTNGSVRNDIFAVNAPNNQNIWCHVSNRWFVRRSLPKYGTPLL